MVAGIVGSLIRSLIAASADRRMENGKPIRRAYYGVFTKIVAALPFGLFAIFAIGGLASMVQGYWSAWQILAIGLGGCLVLGWLMAREFINRSVEWSDTGARFRWLNGEADLAWSEIEKIEIRQAQRNHARIRFRDGRRFGVSVFLTGGNALLHELQRRGVPVVKWGTSEPLPAQRSFKG